MTRRTILIADSDVASARQLDSFIRGFGHDVGGIARTGREALALAERTPAHLVLLDLALDGDASAPATARAIRRVASTPVLFMTDITDAAALRRAGVADSIGCVVKPFAERELRLGIELALCDDDADRSARELDDRFFSVSIDMLCQLGFDGHFRRLNLAWERTLGFSREELMARPFIEFVHPDDRDRTLNQNREVRSGGQALGFENRYLCKDGSYRWLHWNATSHAGDRAIYSMARDITAQKEQAAERERLVQQLQSALAEVRTLQAILPICSYCRRIRDDQNYWQSVEGYVSRYTNSRFSHGICPSCLETHVEPQFTLGNG